MQTEPRSLQTVSLILLLILATAGLPSSAFAGEALLRNPRFESNFNTNSPPPDPALPNGWPYVGPIDEWTGGSGVNDLVYDPTGPFANAGTPVPDGRQMPPHQRGERVHLAPLHALQQVAVAGVGFIRLDRLHHPCLA
jgi:hypothetical protein